MGGARGCNSCLKRSETAGHTHIFPLKNENPSQKLSLADAVLQSPGQSARLAVSSWEVSGQGLLADLHGANR